jgi:hypothetical protein
MKRQVRIFVEGRQLDLFNDETIEVNSTIQNIQDISKTFTDFSQSFTIPTSANNNAIWEYFYENAVNSSINYQERLDGYIEIDMTFFRRGKIQMEKSQLKNGQPNSYTITFYGDVTTLKDLIGEDLLSDLDYTTINHDYTFNEVFDRVQNYGTDWNVCYPLISSNRIWEFMNQYANANIPAWLVNQLGLNANDIHTNQGAINYTELFPAVRVKSIFDIIGFQYGVTFTGAFLNDPRFTQAYLWYKNKNDFEFSGQPQQLDFDTVISFFTPTYPLNFYVNTSLNQITTPFFNGATWMNHVITLDVTSVSSPTTSYWIDTYRNGALFSTTQGTGTAIYGLANVTNVQGLNDVWEFYIRSNFPLTFDSEIQYEVTYITSVNPITTTEFIRYSTVTLNLSAFTNLAQLAPQMKINDFISGILKQFNLTCFGTGVNTYEIVPLDDWYGAGAVIDITEFTDKTEIGVDRVKLYKKIGFAFEQSNSLMNKAFFEQGLKEYGNTEYQYPYDGGEFTIKVPFENLLFNQFTHTGTPTGIQVGYSLDSSFSPYIPKPCLLYKYGGVTATHHIHFTDGSSHNITNDYTMFGQDLTDNGIKYSTNFAPETSSYWLTPIQQSIFATYYFPYLANLFNPKNRLTTIKANLPVSIFTGLKLNDRLIIRDKRYIINEMKTNLVTGETTFQLLNDFMPVLPAIIINASPNTPTSPPPPPVPIVGVPITFPNLAPSRGNTIRATFSSSNPDVILPAPITSSQRVTFILPDVTGNEERITEEADLRIVEDGRQLNTEGANDVIDIRVTYEGEDGSEQTQEIIIIRQ